MSFPPIPVLVCSCRQYRLKAAFLWEKVICINSKIRTVICIEESRDIARDDFDTVIRQDFSVRLYGMPESYSLERHGILVARMRR